MTVANPYHQVNDTGWCACSKATGGCGRVFAGLAGFDAHMERVGKDDDWDRRCRTDEELAAFNLYRDRRGWWHVAGREAEE